MIASGRNSSPSTQIAEQSQSPTTTKVIGTLNSNISITGGASNAKRGISLLPIEPFKQGDSVKIVVSTVPNTRNRTTSARGRDLGAKGSSYVSPEVPN